MTIWALLPENDRSSLKSLHQSTKKSVQGPFAASCIRIFIVCVPTITKAQVAGNIVYKKNTKF